MAQPPSSAIRPAADLATLAGRAAAACAHPVVAWRRLSLRWRAAMLAIYAAASYMLVLTALLGRAALS